MSMAKKPSVVTYHSDIVRQQYLKRLYHPFYNAFMRKVDVIVATSEQYVNSSVDLWPFHNKCRIIPLTIGCQRFPEINEHIMEETRSKYGKDFLLFVGVLRYYKGLDFLLELPSLQ